MNKELCKDFQKFVFIANNTAVTIEAESKSVAIEVFKNEFEHLYNDNWQVIRILAGVTIDYNIERF